MLKSVIRYKDNIKMRNCCEVRKNASRNIKRVAFLDYESIYWILKERLCTMEFENEGDSYGI